MQGALWKGVIMGIYICLRQGLVFPRLILTSVCNQGCSCMLPTEMHTCPSSEFLNMGWSRRHPLRTIGEPLMTLVFASLFVGYATATLSASASLKPVNLCR